MDREKVIEEIEDALSCNLAKAGNVYKLSLNGLKDKALIDAMALLKEQEAVEPKWFIDGHNPAGAFRCGACGERILEKNIDFYCSKCGKPVLWEGR